MKKKIALHEIEKRKDILELSGVADLTPAVLVDCFPLNEIVGEKDTLGWIDLARYNVGGSGTAEIISGSPA